MKRVVRKGDSFFDPIFGVSALLIAFLMGFCMKIRWIYINLYFYNKFYNNNGSITVMCMLPWTENVPYHETRFKQFGGSIFMRFGSRVAGIRRCPGRLLQFP